MIGKAWLGWMLVANMSAVIGISAASATDDEERRVVKRGDFADDLLVKGDEVSVEGRLARDLFVAGGEVNVDGSVSGDVFAAGGRLTLGKAVRGSLLAAGGRIDVGGEVGAGIVLAGGRLDLEAAVDGDVFAAAGQFDLRGTLNGDLRAGGGEITVHDVVDGDLLIGGGRVELRDRAHIKGKAIIGAGAAHLGGRIDGSLRAGARSVVLAGTVAGNVHLSADTIRVLPSARIGGDLVYHSPEAIELDEGQVGGDITFVQSEEMHKRFGGIHAAAGAAHLVFILGLILVAACLVLVAPALFPALDARMQAKRWKALGLGVAVLLAAPALVVLLMATGVGLPLALLLAGCYLLVATLGFFGAAYGIGRRLFTWLKRDLGATPWKRVGATACGLLVFGLVALVPVAGVLVVLLATAFGVGALLFGGLDLRKHRAAT